MTDQMDQARVAAPPVARPAKIALCCVPHPMSPKTWSRTPLNIAEELERRGRLGPAIGGVKHDGWRAKAAALATMLRYRLPPRFVTPGAASRALHARHMAPMIRTTGATHVMHFSGIRHLPVPAASHVRQYLFLDSTWRDYWIDTDALPPREARFRLDVDRQLGDAYRSMNHLFPTAQYVRDTLINHYRIDPSRVTVVGTGTGVVKPYFGPKDYANRTILYANKGVDTRHKGGRLLLDAFQLARKVVPDLKLMVVGKQRLREEDFRAPNVTVFEFLPVEDLQRLFNEAALFAMPAPGEHWGLVYIEALMCRTPILGLNRKAFPELSGGGKYGFIVLDPPTPRAVADAIVEAMADPERLRGIGEQGQKFVLERFTWEKVVDRMLAAIDR